jgi:hypothetical protein
MNRQASPDPLTLEAARWADQLCDRYETAWHAGDPLTIETLLSEAPPEAHAAAFAELLLLDLELRSRRGEEPDEAEYRHRFPQYGSLIGRIMARTRRSTSRQVLGPYLLLEQLGAGGMGVVWKATDRRIGRIVALKVLRSDHLAGLPPERGCPLSARFRREADATARLLHPNIIPIFEVGQAEGQFFYSMPYVEGRNLGQMLAAGPLPEREAAAIIEQVARGVHHAHTRGILHRDLKPKNILIDERSGAPCVADFGLAKRLDGPSEATETGHLVGTPSYMAPEQIDASAKVQVACDIYGLGSTLYAALTGRPPFHGDTIPETLHQVLSHDPIPPRTLNPAIGPDLETIVLKCLEKEPGQRYSSALDLADDLQRYLTGAPIFARPTGPVEFLWLWCRQHRTSVALAAALLVTLAGWFITLTMVMSFAEEKSTERSLVRRILPPLLVIVGVAFGSATFAIAFYLRRLWMARLPSGLSVRRTALPAVSNPTPQLPYPAGWLAEDLTPHDSLPTPKPGGLLRPDLPGTA